MTVLEPIFWLKSITIYKLKSDFSIPITIFNILEKNFKKNQKFWDKKN